MNATDLDAEILFEIAYLALLRVHFYLTKPDMTKMAEEYRDMLIRKCEAIVDSAKLADLLEDELPF